jgi:hypothetical protein
MIVLVNLEQKIVVAVDEEVEGWLPNHHHQTPHPPLPIQLPNPLLFVSPLNLQHSWEMMEHYYAYCSNE